MEDTGDRAGTDLPAHFAIAEPWGYVPGVNESNQLNVRLGVDVFLVPDLWGAECNRYERRGSDHKSRYRGGGPPKRMTGEDDPLTLILFLS